MTKLRWLLLAAVAIVIIIVGIVVGQRQAAVNYGHHHPVQITVFPTNQAKNEALNYVEVTVTAAKKAGRQTFAKANLKRTTAKFVTSAYAKKHLHSRGTAVSQTTMVRLPQVVPNGSTKPTFIYDEKAGLDLKLNPATGGVWLDTTP